MKSMKWKLIAAALASAAFAACGESGDATGDTGVVQNTAAANGGSQAAAAGTIADTLDKSADHSSFVGAVKAAGIGETMAGEGIYTVFAPVNAAFQKLPAGAGERLMQPESKAELTNVLTYHVVPGLVTTKDLSAALERGGGKTRLATVGGGTLNVAQADGGITISDGKNDVARVTQADMMASNGVVHAIDGVLMPQ